MSTEPERPWQRLHPLSPVVHMARSASALLIFLAVPFLSNSHHGGLGNYLDLAILALAAASGVLSWLVTRWRIQAGTLLVETGLLRRRHTRIPLQRIQSVDVVKPALARLFGLAEVRVRTGVAQRGTARLAYVPEEQADAIRAQLASWSRGDQALSADLEERALARVHAGRLLLAVWLDGTVPAALMVSVAFIALGIVTSRGSGAALFGAGAGWGLLCVVGVASRLNSQLNYEVLAHPDSITVRGGLLGTVRESIPRGRIQAIRMAEPLLWRPFQWVRLDVDVAGGQRRQRENRAAAGQLRTLLPVARKIEAMALLLTLGPTVAPDLLPAPSRAGFKAPLSYHFLGAGTTGSWGAASVGRLRRLTTWVPLAKVQSVRWTQGPVQRRLGLANVHLDIAGHRVAVALRDRSALEAQRLALELPDRCRQARLAAGAATSSPASASAVASGPGAVGGSVLGRDLPGSGPG